MGLWKDLKTALALGADIATLRHDVDQLRIEWTDVLDQMKAREERMRKRDRVAMKKHVEADIEPDEHPPEQPQLALAGSKTELRMAARQRGMIR